MYREEVVPGPGLPCLCTPPGPGYPGVHRSHLVRAMHAGSAVHEQEEQPCQRLPVLSLGKVVP